MATNLRNSDKGTQYLVAREEQRAELRISIFRVGFIVLLFGANAIRLLFGHAFHSGQFLSLAVMLIVAVLMHLDIWWIGRARNFDRFYKPFYKFVMITIDALSYSLVFHLGARSPLVAVQLEALELPVPFILTGVYLTLFGIYIIVDLLRFSAASSFFSLLMFSAGFLGVSALLPASLRGETSAGLFFLRSSTFLLPAALMTVIAAYVSSRIASMVQESKVQLQLERYLPPALTREQRGGNIPNLNAGAAQIGDTAILFADIRGFTAISERMKPKELIDLLNTYFTDMIEEVFSRNGTIDKIVGDELMALFGAPMYTSTYCEQAVLSALGMMDRLRALNKLRQMQGEETLEMGIGIHEGEVVFGSVGNPQRMDFTAIGDPVNTASRLERLTRKMDSDIIVSNRVLERISPSLRSDLEVEEYGQAKIRGKNNSITVYGIRRRER